MMFQTEVGFYEVLELKPDASAQDIRNAYLRLKSSYRKDNPALYSVLDPSETEIMISKIEEAFQILSDPDNRREYDERNGFAERIERKIFSIDRAPWNTGSGDSIDAVDGGDDMLVAPTTDYEGMTQRGETTSTGINTFQLPTHGPRESPSFLGTSLPEAPISRSPNSGFIDKRESERSAAESVVAKSVHHSDPVLNEIEGETEWRGPTLRKIRELRRYSLDDIAQLTKISKSYLVAIEAEAFAKLPAPVFVRGFILQFARTLKIPAEPVATAYMARFQKRPGST